MSRGTQTETEFFPKTRFLRGYFFRTVTPILLSTVAVWWLYTTTPRSWRW